MNLRALAVALLVSLAVALPVDGAPPEKLYRIGMLERTPTTANAPNVEGFRRGLWFGRRWT